MTPAQLLTRILLGACGGAVLIGALLLFGLGGEIEPSEFNARSLGQGDDTLAELGQFRLAPLEEYAEVRERPLFNDDRLPSETNSEDVADEGEETGEEIPPVALNVSVKGIIITGDVKVALVHDNTTKETLRLKEGMPMEGEMGAWVLSSIEPRKLVFEGGGDEPAEVELEVYKQALKGGAPAPAVAVSRPGASEDEPAEAAQEQPAEVVNAAFQNTDSDADRAAKAEEIRRRVAERRAQLRAEAARRRAEQEKEQE